MIEPTVGRVVWYRPGAHEMNLSLSDQPLAAIITYVNEDDTINLVVFGKGGDCHQRASVPLWQGDGDAPERRTYAEWMAERPAEFQVAPPAPVDHWDSLQVTPPFAPKPGLRGPDSEPAKASEPSAPPYDGPAVPYTDQEANRYIGDVWPDKKPTYRATPVKPSTEPVQPLPPAPIDPDPYASSVDSVGYLASPPENPDRPLD